MSILILPTLLYSFFEPMDLSDCSKMEPLQADSISLLLTTYNELNSSTITVLDEAPSALEFMRFVSLNRPFVVRGFASTVRIPF